MSHSREPGRKYLDDLSAISFGEEEEVPVLQEQTLLYVQNKTGNIGVGTSTPGAKLDVEGNVKISGDLEVKGERIYRGEMRQTGDLIIESGKLGIGTANPSEKLEVSGHVIAEPIIGQWYPSTHFNNPDIKVWVSIILDVEAFNTNTNYFTKNNDNKGITIKISGYYKIEARALVFIGPGDYGHLGLRKNEEIIEQGHGHVGVTDATHDDRFINYTGFINAGDIIRLQVYHQQAARTHPDYSGPHYTKLTIRRLS